MYAKPLKKVMDVGTLKPLVTVVHPVRSAALVQMETVLVAW